MQQPRVLFHTAPPEARDSIRRVGLTAGDPSARDHSLLGQPIGVYATAGPDRHGLWARGDAWDVWEIRVPWGVPVVPDPYGNGLVLLGDVPAEHCRLHARMRSPAHRERHA